MKQMVEFSERLVVENERLKLEVEGITVGRTRIWKLSLSLTFNVSLQSYN